IRVATRVLTVAQKVMRDSGMVVPLEIPGQYRKGDIRHNFADITLIQEKLGYAPSVDFATGIRQFCDWVNQQEIQADRYEQSLDELRKKGLMK
ncbi:MAG TPA: hypothetical protein PLU78_01030, partial [Chitinophagales bacterium]|nr:hypothetical protein [Chitinophagales bacterium]